MWEKEAAMWRALKLGVVSVCVALLGLSGVVYAATLLVDDFDDGDKPNALGGDFGAWDKDPSDPTQKCTIAFDKAGAFGGAGYSLRMDYDVDSPNPAYNGFWMKLQETDMSAYKTISFYIRGDGSKGFTNQVKLELKNGKEVGKYLLKGVTDQWQQAKIPLKDFAGLTSLKGMTEFVVVFDDVTSTKKTGSIYLDEITLDG